MERAVGKVVKALRLAKDGRADIQRDYRQGKVYVGSVMVAKWDDMLNVMMFAGEGMMRALSSPKTSIIPLQLHPWLKARH